MTDWALLIWMVMLVVVDIRDYCSCWVTDGLWADQKERRLLPLCERPIGSNIRCVAFSPVWCARSSASIFARRRATMTGSIASSTPALPADVVARAEPHAARGDRLGGESGP